MMMSLIPDHDYSLYQPTNNIECCIKTAKRKRMNAKDVEPNFFSAEKKRITKVNLSVLKSYFQKQFWFVLMLSFSIKICEKYKAKKVFLHNQKNLVLSWYHINPHLKNRQILSQD